jgi:cell division protein FtsB
MPEKLLNLKKVKIIKAISIFAVILTLFLILYFPNYARLKKLKEANQQVCHKIQTLEKGIEDLEEKIGKDEKDPYFLEEFVRNELGAAKKKEIVIDILE